MSARRGEPLALAVIDLDDFKGVNDRSGHAAGDRLLGKLAGAWTASLRPGDLLARFGGDEFVLLLGGATEGQVGSVLARLARSHPARWTTGAVLCSDEESLDDTINRADARLYLAKQPGGHANRPDRSAAITSRATGPRLTLPEARRARSSQVVRRTLRRAAAPTASPLALG